MNKEYRCPVCNAVDAKVMAALVSLGRYVHGLHVQMDALECMLEEALQELNIEHRRVPQEKGNKNASQNLV